LGGSIQILVMLVFSTDGWQLLAHIFYILAVYLITNVSVLINDWDTYDILIIRNGITELRPGV